MTNLNQAIAQHLNVTEQAIIKVEEWANVLFTVVKGLGARFVSKRVKPQTLSSNAIEDVKLGCFKGIQKGKRQEEYIATLIATGRLTYVRDSGQWQAGAYNGKTAKSVVSAFQKNCSKYNVESKTISEQIKELEFALEFSKKHNFEQNKKERQEEMNRLLKTQKAVKELIAARNLI
jgi:hypothetical protein